MLVKYKMLLAHIAISLVLSALPTPVIVTKAEQTEDNYTPSSSLMTFEMFKTAYLSGRPNLTFEEFNEEYKDFYYLVALLEYANKKYGYEAYSKDFAIGLYANIRCEGERGIVESAFSLKHSYDFFLPSGGNEIKTLEDIDYLLKWTTESSSDGTLNKGSCGVSLLQWSFGRRINWLNILRERVSPRTEVEYGDLVYADTQMILMELNPNGEYYQTIMNYIKEDSTCEDYAEAICDFYIRPRGADLDFSNTNISCWTRRMEASSLNAYLKEYANESLLEMYYFKSNGCGVWREEHVEPTIATIKERTPCFASPIAKESKGFNNAGDTVIITAYVTECSGVEAYYYKTSNDVYIKASSVNVNR